MKTDQHQLRQYTFNQSFPKAPTNIHLYHKQQESTLNPDSLAYFKYGTPCNMRYRFYEMAQGTNQYLPKVRYYSDNVFYDKLEKQENIKNLNQKNEELSKNLSVAKVQNEHLCEENFILHKKINQLEKINNNLRLQILQAERKYDLSELNKNSQNTYLIQNQHLRNDNKKLVEMLKHTKEYQDFADRGDDAVGTLRFLKLKQKQLNSHNTKYVHYCACNQKLQIKEDRWCPQQAHKKALSIMKQNKWKFTETVLNQLLYEINKIYSIREHQLIKHIKNRNTEEIKQLKRKFSQQHHMDEDVKRLKKDINKIIHNNIESVYRQLKIIRDRSLKTQEQLKAASIIAIKGWENNKENDRKIKLIKKEMEKLMRSEISGIGKSKNI